MPNPDYARAISSLHGDASPVQGTSATDIDRQIPTLTDADMLGHLIEKFLAPRINLSPNPTQDADGNELLPALDEDVAEIEDDAITESHK
ncbi:MAG: hypothetical protein ACR2P9_03505 [Gammaproteobacteria bacterium]